MFNKKDCVCPHHYMYAVFLVLIGVVFLLKGVGYVTQQFVDITWPVLVIVGGLTKLFEKKCGCC